MTTINRDWLFYQQQQNDLYYTLESNRDLQRKHNNKYIDSILPELQNNYLSRYTGYNRQMGTLKYSNTNYTEKSQPMMLDGYGNDYEEGRRTTLSDTLNKSTIKVSGYIVDVNSIKKEHTGASVKINTVGYKMADNSGLFS